MDTGEGKFAKLGEEDIYYENDRTKPIVRIRKKYLKAKGIFTVGEEVEIKGSRFQVTKIFGKAIHLKLLPAE